MGISVSYQNAPEEVKSWIKNAVGGSKERLKELHKSGQIYDCDHPFIGRDLKRNEFNFLADDSFNAVYAFWKNDAGILYEASFELEDTK